MGSMLSENWLQTTIDILDREGYVVLPRNTMIVDCMIQQLIDKGHSVTFHKQDNQIVAEVSSAGKVTEALGKYPTTALSALLKILKNNE